MKKNNPEIFKIIIETIEKGFGRVAACKSANIHYGTLLKWLDPEHPTFNSEFSERLKEAEQVGRQTLKETLENVILKAATDKDKPVWQAAAWRLERSFNSEYGIKQAVDHTIREQPLFPDATNDSDK